MKRPALRQLSFWSKATQDLSTTTFKVLPKYHKSAQHLPVLLCKLWYQSIHTILHLYYDMLPMIFPPSSEPTHDIQPVSPRTPAWLEYFRYSAHLENDYMYSIIIGTIIYYLNHLLNILANSFQEADVRHSNIVFRIWRLTDICVTFVPRAPLWDARDR